MFTKQLLGFNQGSGQDIIAVYIPLWALQIHED